MDKMLREQTRALAPLGYEYMGKRHGAGSGPGRGHHVFRHRDDGYVLVAAATPRNPGRSLAMTVAKAKRADKARESVSERWREFLRDQYGVGDTEEKVVEWSEQLMRERFKRAYPELAQRVTDSVFSVAIGNSDLFEVIEKGVASDKFARKGRLLIRGPLAGLVRDDNGEGSTQPETAEMEAEVGVPAAGGEHPGEPVPGAAGVDERAGAEQDARPVGADAGSERAADQGEPAAARRKRVVAAPVSPGVRLAEGLAAQLVDALAGDLRAENELLRGAIGTVAAQLAEISRELAAALDLGSTQSEQKRDDFGIGPVAIRYLRALEAADPPTPFSVDDAVAAVVAAGITGPSKGHKGDLRQSIGSILPLLTKAGYLRRVARGVYAWPE